MPVAQSCRPCCIPEAAVYIFLVCAKSAACFAEVLPVFLAVIQEHRDAATRDKLTHALFNLVKKPNSAQRRLIGDSCADLAGRIGPSRTAEELLPQCWEQVCLQAVFLFTLWQMFARPLQYVCICCHSKNLTA